MTLHTNTNLYLSALSLSLHVLNARKEYDSACYAHHNPDLFYKQDAHIHDKEFW